jgi:prepilin-type N-terminal cleavage/methylation domain-containing protein
MEDLFNRVSRRRRKGQRGFTLIELLVVIAILGVLAAIVVFNVTGIKSKGNVAACNADAQTVQAALDQYYNDNNDSYAPYAIGQDSSAGGWPGWGSLDKYLNNPPATGNGAPCSSFTLQASNGTGPDIYVKGNANP